MRILIKFKDGMSDIFSVENIDMFSKNPCQNCRSDGGCYEHGCFAPEDWGDFLDLGNDRHVKIQDIAHITILSI